MSLQHFDSAVDEILLAIEDAIEDSEADIEYDTIGGILTLEFPDNSRIIINRQSATKQIWVAAKSGGFHFNFDNSQWFEEKEKTPLADKLTDLIQQQYQAPLDLDLSQI